MICVVDEHGFCERHAQRHVGTGLRLALEDSEAGESFRALNDDFLRRQREAVAMPAPSGGQTRRLETPVRQRERTPAARLLKFTPASSRGGVGTELKRHLTALSVEELPGCGCGNVMRKMDNAGIDGVIARRDEFLKGLRATGLKYGWTDRAQAAWKVRRLKGWRVVLTVAWRWLTRKQDEYEWLLNEAIRAAEAAGAPREPKPTPPRKAKPKPKPQEVLVGARQAAPQTILVGAAS